MWSLSLDNPCRNFMSKRRSMQVKLTGINWFDSLLTIDLGNGKNLFGTWQGLEELIIYRIV